MTAGLTLFALVAFAANSLLCRLALGAGTIDAASFTTVRLGSGAAALLLLSALLPSRPAAVHGREGPRWRSAGALFLYAVAFSFAYRSLTTGSGALILFGAVQTTMIASALWGGERPTRLEWIGLAAALLGLVYLLLPGLTAPPLVGALLMTAAGIAWGFYSLWGRRSADPIGDTTRNFVRAVPFALVVSLVLLAGRHLSAPGIGLAAASGAVASGVGYVAWYAALPHLTATRAATVQLAVPLLAAAAGVVVLNEAITLRLIVASVFILGGIALTIAGRTRRAPRR